MYNLSVTRMNQLYLDILNGVKSVLADVSSLSPSSEL